MKNNMWRQAISAISQTSESMSQFILSSLANSEKKKKIIVLCRPQEYFHNAEHLFSSFCIDNVLFDNTGITEKCFLKITFVLQSVLS